MRRALLRRLALPLGMAVLALPCLTAAQIKVGITIASTGAAASSGVPQRNTVALLPTELGGRKVEYIVLDDGSQAQAALRNLHRLINEDQVDVVIGTSVSEGSLAMVEVAGEAQTPMISLAADAGIVEPVEGPRQWVYKTPQNNDLMAALLGDAMGRHGVKRLAFIGQDDAYGEGWLKGMNAAAQAQGIELVATARYAARAGGGVAAQVSKLLAAKPDGVLVAASGAAAAVPPAELKKQGYKGLIYQTHGAADTEVLRTCGEACNDMYLVAGPLLVAGQLPEDHPARAAALDYKAKYEARYGPGTANTFGGHLWDAALLIGAAVPAALQAGAEPGTSEFRQALRAALETIKDLPASQGVFTLSPTDHAGLDERARVLVKVVKGKWVYQPDPH